MAKDPLEKKATPLTEEQLSAKQTELRSVADNLAQEIETFEKEKEEFKNHVDSNQKVLSGSFEDLKAKKTAFETEKEEFKIHVDSETQRLSEGFAYLEEKQKEFHKKVAQFSETPENEEKAIEPLKCIYDNEEYQFDSEAPDLILFDGKGWTHQEIIENEDVLLQIIGGGLGLIKKL